MTSIDCSVIIIVILLRPAQEFNFSTAICVFGFTSTFPQMQMTQILQNNFLIPNLLLLRQI